MAAAELTLDEYARPVDYTKTTGPRAVARILSNNGQSSLNKSTVHVTDPDDPETPVPLDSGS